MKSWVDWFVWFCSCQWIYWITSIRDVFEDTLDNYKYVGFYKNPYDDDEEEEERVEEEEQESRTHNIHKSFKGLVDQGALEHGTIVVCKKHIDKQGVVRVGAEGKKYGIEYGGVVYSYVDFLKNVNGGVKGNPWKLLYTIDEDGGLLDSFETLWEERKNK